MRFLADENFPGAAVSALRERGHDVVWVGAESPGISDAEVLNWSSREDRILLTFDKDFGELAANATGALKGVILFRLPAMSPGAVGLKLADLVSAREDWSGHFSVIEPGRVRMRLIPRRRE